MVAEADDEERGLRSTKKRGNRSSFIILCRIESAKLSSPREGGKASKHPTRGNYPVG